jgi:hypothetical protein
VAGQVQRDVQARARACGDLFEAEPFDAALFGTLAQAIAFGAPWLDAERLRIAGRTTIWTLGLDWRIDYLARSRAEVRDVVRRCRAVATGRRPGPDDHLGRFLADIRDELATVDGFAALRPVWQDELDQLLTAHTRDWQWRNSPTKPTLDEYLANAANIAFSFVYVSHLIYTTEPPPARDLARLRTAGWAVQRAVRLLNDLATYARDVAWGDLNALALPGVTRARLTRRVQSLTGAAARRIEPVRARYPDLAGYLERQLGFCTGFYGVADFWAEP